MGVAMMHYARCRLQRNIIGNLQDFGLHERRGDCARPSDSKLTGKATENATAFMRWRHPVGVSDKLSTKKDDLATSALIAGFPQRSGETGVSI